MPDAAQMHERVVTLNGDPSRPVTLQTTIFTPDGPGPFPTVIFNHGADNISRTHRGTRQRLSYAALYFLSRGYAVIQPMARGFADSGGELADNGCDFAKTGRDNARDLAEVVDQVAAMPFVDAHRIVMAGQSFGGWSTLAYGALNRADLRGAIAFVPTLRSSACPLSGRDLIEGAEEYGRESHLPLLWLYGETDSLVPPGTWRGMIAAYHSGGAPLETVNVGQAVPDSHHLAGDPTHFNLWMPRLDAFLKQLGLPSAETQPAFLPTQSPKATTFARIDDVAAVPYLSAAGQEKYRQFLAMRLPRAIVIAPDGTMAASSGGYDPLGQALGICRNGHLGCTPYAIDTNVVWTGPRRMVAPSPKPMTASLTIQGQHSTQIVFASFPDRNCATPVPPRITITTHPMHGLTHVNPQDGIGHYAPGSRDAACNGKSVHGTRILYTPADYYTGPDMLAFQVTAPGHASQTLTINLTIR